MNIPVLWNLQDLKEVLVLVEHPALHLVEVPARPPSCDQEQNCLFVFIYMPIVLQVSAWV